MDVHFPAFQHIPMESCKYSLKKPPPLLTWSACYSGLLQTRFEVNGIAADHFCPQFGGMGPPTAQSKHRLNTVAVPYCFWDIRAGQNFFSR